MEAPASIGLTNTMLRVGYPEILEEELFGDFPQGIELIPLPYPLDHDVDIDVWIPDPYPPRAIRIAPRLRGVRLVLSLMAGTEWIPGAMGPHVTICNASGAHHVAYYPDDYTVDEPAADILRSIMSTEYFAFKRKLAAKDLLPVK